MEFWDYDRLGYLHPLAGLVEDIAELQEARAKIEADLAFQNEAMKAAAANGDRDAEKAARKAYIELSKARDLVYAKLKTRNKGVLPPAPARPQPARPAAPAMPALKHGECYEGPVPKGHFKRGELIGSEEPFTVAGFRIQRSPVCSSGWVAIDPSIAVHSRAASPQAAPIIRRRAVGALW